MTPSNPAKQNTAAQLPDLSKVFNRQGTSEGLGVRTAISKYGSEYFTKDMAGKGRTFLPGVFVLAWYAETFDLDKSHELKLQFKQNAEMPLDTFVQGLYE